MATSDLFAQEPSSDPTLSAEGSRARISASRVLERVSVASAADYGRNTPELWATFDRATSSWRTSALSLLGGCPLFSETLPRSGMTRSGTLYRLRPLTRLIYASASGSSRTMLPTPRAAEYKGTGPIGSASHSHRLSRGYLDATIQDHTGVSGQLSPRFVEWMMGFPDGWTEIDSAAWEMLSSRRSRKCPGGRS